MSTGGWAAEDVARHQAKLGKTRPEARPVGTTGIEIGVAKKSKYRNVRTRAAGETFDSKREADYWLLLKAREQLGEISELRRQVEFPLYCPTVRVGAFGVDQQVSAYVADFVYRDTDGLHVVDAKGDRTRLYDLKKKWLELQDGIVIEEV